MALDIDFTEHELKVIKRVLGFATVNIPVKDGAGHSIYPTVDTQKTAQELIERIDSLGVPDSPGLYIAFDPQNDLKDKIALIWQERADGYVYQIKGKVSEVQGSDIEGWSVLMGDVTMGPYSREELKRSCQIELDL